MVSAKVLPGDSPPWERKYWEQVWGLVNQSLGHWGSECKGLERQRTRGSSLGKTPLLEENGAFWKGAVSLGGIIVKEGTSCHCGPERKKMMSLSMCVCARSLQLCSTLGDSMDYGLSEASPSVRGTLQARILKWIVMPSSRESSLPRDQTCVSYVSCIGRQILYH